MSEETLLTAARRAVRFFNIDMNNGGLMMVETQQAMETLDKMVLKEAQRDKRLAEELAQRAAENKDEKA